MENNTENKNGTCKGRNDLRTFLIAFLTSVIVVAVYHFGTGCFAILKGNCGNGCAPVGQKYVLVPVAALPSGCPMMQEGPRMRGPEGGEHRGRRFDRRQPGFRRHGDKGPGMRCHGGPAPAKEGKPDQVPPAADKTPAPEAETAPAQK